MKITKYIHACILLEKEDTNLLIDPGSFTALPADVSKINFVIVTEEHFDHFNLDNLQKIANKNPEVQIYTTAAVYESMSDTSLNIHKIVGSQIVDMGAYSITFEENDHATIYRMSPCKSLAITINDHLYYPSDTFTTTDKSIQILALPTAGPWFKVSEAIEFANAIDSKIIIPTHNALNSDIGNEVIHNSITSNLSKGKEFIYLAPGKSIEIDS